MKESKKIVLIATGGTIAGQGSSATDLTGYTSGVLSLHEILEAVPTINDYGPFEYVQFSNIESSDITGDQWIALAKLAQKTLDRDDVAGLVITHGTDSMEETAYFLHLTVHTDKPIIITGSMRPAGAVSADGPINLLGAVQSVRSPESHGKGVIVSLNGYLDSARDVTKMNTTNVDTFGNPLFGHMGVIQDGRPYYSHTSTKVHTSQSIFYANDLDSLPNVGIFYCYAGVEAGLLNAFLTKGLDGLILVGLGHGTIPEQIRKVTKNLSIPVVRASRTFGGMVSEVGSDKIPGYLVCDTLNPMKARILLTLALTKTQDKEEIQNLFHTY